MWRARRRRSATAGAPSRVAAGVWGAAEVVRIDHRGARVFVHLALGTALPRHAVEVLVARTAVLLRRSHAGAEEVWRRRARGGDLAECQRVLRCGVRFRQPSIRLALQADHLERPLRTANPQAAAALAAGLTRAGSRATTTAGQLAAAVAAALAGGQRPEREPLARALGMSGRTLARRLALEHRGFSGIVDDVRRSEAERLVAAPRSTSARSPAGSASPTSPPSASLPPLVRPQPNSLSRPAHCRVAAALVAAGDARASPGWGAARRTEPTPPHPRPRCARPCGHNGRGYTDTVTNPGRTRRSAARRWLRPTR
jgi:AraC-like DNA-binding protein